jgi:hypothetical protein
MEGGEPPGDRPRGKRASQNMSNALLQLRLLQREGGTMDAAQMNDKIAGSFEGACWNLEEYLAGVEKHIGLAAVKMYEGMQMKCCSATDSKAPFKVPNNGRYETTPEEAWNFVVNPDLNKTYPGGRLGTKLDVYNLAHGAQKHGGARFNMPLEAATLAEAAMLAEVARQNACSAGELVDSVKTVALRWGRASYLPEGPLKRAIKKLLGGAQGQNSKTGSIPPTYALSPIWGRVKHSLFREHPYWTQGVESNLRHFSTTWSRSCCIFPLLHRTLMKG